jgi:pantetheine-phosphate adenylyltransferase
MKKALYPGSFDPITNGHVDIINRALTIVDELTIGISVNQEKSPLFSLSDRKAMIEETFCNNSRVRVAIFEGLLVHFAQKISVPLVVRGLRAASDFEYEFMLAAMNRKLDGDVETIFLMTGSDTYFLSSRLIKEIALLGGDVNRMVPAHVAEALYQKKSQKGK